jgi:hypothetical protein
MTYLDYPVQQQFIILKATTKMSLNIPSLQETFQIVQYHKCPLFMQMRD